MSWLANIVVLTLAMKGDCTNYCPPGWTSLTSGCYRIIEDLVKFDEAKTSCQTKGGVLAEMTTQNEVDDLSSFYKTSGITTTVWLGASDKAKESEWIWITSGQTVTLDLWAKFEPNNYGGNEDCMEWDGTYWNDIPCNHDNYKSSSLCKYTGGRFCGDGSCSLGRCESTCGKDGYCCDKDLGLWFNGACPKEANDKVSEGGHSSCVFYKEKETCEYCQSSLGSWKYWFSCETAMAIPSWCSDYQPFCPGLTC